MNESEQQLSNNKYVIIFIQRERETDRQTDKLTDRQTEKETDRHRERKGEREHKNVLYKDSTYVTTSVC